MYLNGKIQAKMEYLKTVSFSAKNHDRDKIYICNKDRRIGLKT